MTVTLPYTYEGRTARVGEERGKRIAVPLTGTLSSPQLDLQKMLEGQLREQILERGLKELFEELKR